MKFISKENSNLPYIHLMKNYVLKVKFIVNPGLIAFDNSKDPKSYS